MDEKKRRPPIKSYGDLEVYQRAFKAANEIFRISALWPLEEKYDLTSQIRKATRSICANIAEGWAKRKFENVFKRHLVDGVGSAAEVKVWLDFALECGYLQKNAHGKHFQEYTEISKMLEALLNRWVTYP